MTVYTCEKCEKTFPQKSEYDRHLKKKYPCVTQEKITELDEKQLIELKEKISESDSLKYLESFFNKIKDIVRKTEHIAGDKALEVITDFLFLRMLNYEMKKDNNLNFITKKYKQKITVNKQELEIDDYKKYFEWEKLMELLNKIEKNSNDNESKELLFNVVCYVIFDGIFKYNENTKPIYKNRRFLVKKISTVIKLLKEFDKVKFDKFDVDIKGKIYESVIQKEASTNKSFGQFFTPRFVTKYIISCLDIKVKKNGSFEKIMDPAMGTGGLLVSYLSSIKKYANDNKIKLDEDVSKYVYGYEVVDDTLKLGQMNILLKSGSFNKSLKNEDFLECGCLDYIKEEEKFNGNIVMNPPFSLDKYCDLNDEQMKKVYKTQTNSGTLLFALSALNTIKEGKKVIYVSQNGKEIFGKNKEFVNVRKYIMENSNVYKIAINPEGSFKPYTGVQTLIVMLEKGKKTEEIQFVKLENINDEMKETEICKVKFKDIEKNNYSWNYKEYHKEENIKYTNIKNIKINEILIKKNGKSLPKNKIKYGDYPVIGGGEKYGGYHNEFNYDEKLILISRVGTAGHISKIKEKCFVTDLVGAYSTNSKYNFDFVYYYLKNSEKNIKNKYVNKSCAPSINLGNFTNEFKILIPPIEIQNKIVEELDGLFALKENFKKSVDIMENTYKKSIFEMLLYGCENKKEYKLKNICEFNKNNKADEIFDEYNYIDISSVEKGVLTEIKNIKKNDLPSRAKKYGKLNDILLSSVRPNLKNYLFLTENNLKKNTIISTGFIIMSANIKIINPKMLYYFVTDDNTTNILIEKTSGANYPSINIDNIENITFNIPSLEDQERIIKEMEKYDLEIEFKKNEIKKIDEYAKTIFDNYLNKCKTNEIKNNKEKNEENKDNNEDIIEELNNLSDDNKSKKSKKKKNIVKKEESESEEDKYEKITIKEKEYIKDGKKIYKIKEGKKGKLYGKLDKKGNFEKIV